MWLITLAVSLALGSDWLSEGGDAQHTGWQKRGKTLNVKSVGKLQLLWKRKLDSRAGAVLSSPVILGRLITHRGIKELVFVVGDSDDVYAVDADLGTLFWTRQLGGASSGCNIPATPALTPPPDIPGGLPEDDDDEGLPRRVRPLYVLSRDGTLHAINPLNGGDISAPVAFLPPDAHAESLTLMGGVVSPVTSRTCGGAPDIVNGKSATWTDAHGTQHVYTATAHGITSGTWTSREMREPVAPVINNGVVFALSRDAILYALDAATGKELYSSRQAAAAHVSGLAVANGHICFTAGNTLYCFGFPVDL